MNVSENTRSLLSQLRALRRAHRDGISPHYGQLETLFDTADTLERQLDEAAPATPCAPCACRTPGCNKPPVGGSSNYADLCLACAGNTIANALLVPAS